MQLPVIIQRLLYAAMTHNLIIVTYAIYSKLRGFRSCLSCPLQKGEESYAILLPRLWGCNEGNMKGALLPMLVVFQLAGGNHFLL